MDVGESFDRRSPWVLNCENISQSNELDELESHRVTGT